MQTSRRVGMINTFGLIDKFGIINASVKQIKKNRTFGASSVCK